MGRAEMRAFFRSLFFICRIHVPSCLLWHGARPSPGARTSGANESQPRPFICKYTRNVGAAVPHSMAAGGFFLVDFVPVNDYLSIWVVFPDRHERLAAVRALAQFLRKVGLMLGNVSAAGGADLLRFPGRVSHSYLRKRIRPGCAGDG